MRRVNFLFGIHNHQPIGNFDFVFEEAFQKSYLPFLEVLKNFPDFKLAIHFTGILLDWLGENHPELIQLVRKLVKRGQLEVMTGGYFEPILSNIPRNDRVAQIRKLTDTVEKLFDKRPRGMWLAERVWEPTLPSTMVEAGVEFTIIDDTHFKYAGLTDEQLNGFYLTENLGDAVYIFPISKQLRYTIPFQEPEATLDHLRTVANEDSGRIVVFADDGEKFGVWPNTYSHVYEHGWLEQFFQSIIDNREWINLMHFGETIDTFQPSGNIYLPTASYSEMMHWALFPKAFKAYEDFEHYLQKKDFYEDVSVFVRGGFWRNFLAKYPEVNDMQKKMLHVSRKLWSLPEEKRKKAGEAFDHLWAGQCNCPYWHGVFGGLYLSHLRDAIYSNLIEAEKIYDRIAGTSFPKIVLKDVNVDGMDEIIVETATQNAYFNLQRGGLLYELDFKPLNKNLLDTMTRREEGYHDKLQHAEMVGARESGDQQASIHDLVLTKEADLQSRLHYDFYDRKSLVDHVIDPAVTLEQFAAAQYEEKADLLNHGYQLVNRSESDSGAIIVMQRDAFYRNRGNESKIRVKKRINVAGDSGLIEAEYELENFSKQPLTIRFGIEYNFAMQAGHADDRYYYLQEGKIEDRYLDSTGEMESSTFIGLRDDWRKLDVALETSAPARIWRFPVETISLSEGGFERVYQSSAVVFWWDVQLHKNWKVRVSQNVNKLSD